MIRLRLVAARRQQASAIRRVTRKPEVFGSPVGFSTDKTRQQRPINRSREADFTGLIRRKSRTAFRLAEYNPEIGARWHFSTISL